MDWKKYYLLDMKKAQSALLLITNLIGKEWKSHLPIHVSYHLTNLYLPFENEILYISND